MRTLASAPLVATIAITASVAAHAQVTAGTLRGIARDENGTPLRNVTVTLTPTQGTALTSVTDKNGAYVFLGVQPGTYTIKAELETYTPTDAQSITVTQDQVTTADLTLSKAVVKTGTTTIKVAPVRKGQTSSQSNVTARTEQLVKSQPNALYQFPGLVFGQPGVTSDSGGYVHIHGSDYNQVGFQVDGINITEPIYNGFATNIVTVGLKSANVVTGGADATFGGGSSYINQVTYNGRDLKGGTFEYTAGPGNGWKYNGTQIQYGNVTGNGKFDYYGSTIMFSNHFPGNTQIEKLNPSYDGLLKFNYYSDPQNTFTLYINNGRERYYNFTDPKSNAGATYARFDPKTGQLTYTSDYQQDIADQRYDMHYVAWKHNFSDRSVINLRQYRLFSRSADNEENGILRYLRPASTQNGTQIDYSNQIADNYLLRAGFQYIPSEVDWRQVSGIPNDVSSIDPATGLIKSANGLTDRSIQAKPTQTVLYLQNQVRTLQDKGTIDFGLRHASQKEDLVHPDFTAAINSSASLAALAAKYPDRYNYSGSRTIDYTDPRLGVTYSPDNTLVLRASFTQNSEFPDLRRLEQLPTGYISGVAATSNNVTTQEARLLRGAVPFNPLKPSHTDEYNLGIEKGFNLIGMLAGQYSVAGTTFRRNSWSLVQLDVPDLANVFGSTPLMANSNGKSHSSGFDIQLNKRLQRKTDWNGFVSYTNLSSTATDTYYDTGYYPYWAYYLAGTPGLADADFRNLINSQEVPTSWDQRHTVAVVANKQIWKWFDTTVFLDAGSGYPFAGSVGSTDSQHQFNTFGAANFNQVPVFISGTQLTPNNPVPGRTGWHYKFSLNSNFHVSDATNIFVNIDNVFNRKTTVVKGTSTLSGQQYYNNPSAQYPQGSIYYGAQTILTPRFVSFGVRTKF